MFNGPLSKSIHYTTIQQLKLRTFAIEKKATFVNQNKKVKAKPNTETTLASVVARLVQLAT